MELLFSLLGVVVFTVLVYVRWNAAGGKRTSLKSMASAVIPEGAKALAFVRRNPYRHLVGKIATWRTPKRKRVQQGRVTGVRGRHDPRVRVELRPGVYVRRRLRCVEIAEIT